MAEICLKHDCTAFWRSRMVNDTSAAQGEAEVVPKSGSLVGFLSLDDNF